MEQDTRTATVMEAVKRKIASRLLQPGEKLPSIRGFAATMRVSPSTVVTAYDRLAAEGIIYARRGSGFYVADAARPFSVADVGPQLDREIDPFWVSRQSLDAGPDVLKPGCGWLPADWMPSEAMQRGLRALARTGGGHLFDYGETRGALNLRHLLARQFSEEGLEVNPGQVLLTPSGTQAIDLICRFFLRPGDTVLVDDPCYFNFQALLKAHRVEVASVPFTRSGPDTELFEEALTRHKPRLYITNSGLHNPTGATISPQVAHKVLNLVTAHGLVVIEDDIFGSFAPEPLPSLAVLDGLERVIRIGSFSKTLSASVRCGYIAARTDWIEALVDLQVATNFGGPGPVASDLVYGVLSDGSYRKHMEALRVRLAKKRREVAGRLERLGITPWLSPKGGFYLWCSLPDSRDAAAIARSALRRNVVLAPGNVFSVSQTMTGFLRFNVSQMGEGQVYDVLESAMKPAGG
ncbi:PLP-dependent aminotransferase family protein [Roseibium aggregatum]|uniref:aminotransferase-like domain-containing protein n=1 Tax=Roseibium aggregatum TaxID=187304 RepID=UPI001E531E0B|nr:PLP-dependent aminotransferase family protein [Roseibium aggregatum]UES50282.1 aminotransferase class I/II-fold pyridoxal phosphate-dependent enzyme [Roseibium aggregatum]